MSKHPPSAPTASAICFYQTIIHINSPIRTHCKRNMLLSNYYPHLFPHPHPLQAQYAFTQLLSILMWIIVGLKHIALASAICFYPTIIHINVDNSWVKAYCACSGCGWGMFRHYFFRLPSSIAQPDLPQ